MSNSKRSTKVVLVDHEEKMSLINAAEFLETLAKKLREEGSFTLTHDGQTHHVTPTSRVELEIKLEKQNDKHTFEVELEWREGDQNSSISIG
ncbi:amphi-Trp domain-containing protein [Sporosarcina sp. PTS2304]|uniref:amphi-Trp domain-containing protein n=1 Tax=Sporosarcina sp. PTS2304 TaxID=2283194 RepID=UPI000E0D9F53|nr:amphi-Trp domain-containing protein [Sporosarcina sp. PTS2304]AXI00160.1 amphi-Trp domain-containing protein [Sporosarcina sp. PTS2304]